MRGQKMTTWFTSGKNKGKTTRQVMMEKNKGKAEYKYSDEQLAEAAKAAPGSIMKWATRHLNPFKGKK
jgi:hypothetical protein